MDVQFEIPSIDLSVIAEGDVVICRNGTEESAFMIIYDTSDKYSTLYLKKGYASGSYQSVQEAVESFDMAGEKIIAHYSKTEWSMKLVKEVSF